MVFGKTVDEQKKLLKNITIVVEFWVINCPGAIPALIQRGGGTGPKKPRQPLPVQQVPTPTETAKNSGISGR